MPLNLRLQGAAFLPSSPWAVKSPCSGKLNQDYRCNVTHYLCRSSHLLLTPYLRSKTNLTSKKISRLLCLKYLCGVEGWDWVQLSCTSIWTPCFIEPPKYPHFLVRKISDFTKFLHCAGSWLCCPLLFNGFGRIVVHLRKLKLYSVTTSNLSAAVDFTMASKKTTQNLPEAEDQQQEVGARWGGYSNTQQLNYLLTAMVVS